MKIYLFSGLGANERAYSKLQLIDFDVIHVKWILPKEKESIENYCKRLSSQILDKEAIFIGLSFGGIIAIELAKYINPKKIILISSIKSKNELPPYFRRLAKTNLHKLIPRKQLKSSNLILNYFFEAKKSEEKIMLSDIMKDTDPDFAYWAIDKIISWKNMEIFKNLTHIHGLNDRIFPLKYIKLNLPDVIIKNGSHFMIFNKAVEIEKEILKIINN